ncbi:hypothetical protein D3C85_1102710 [compost metagenome]
MKPATLDSIDGRVTKILVNTQERLRDHGAPFRYLLFRDRYLVASCSFGTHLYGCNILLVLGEPLGVRRLCRANAIGDLLLMKCCEVKPSDIDCAIWEEHRRPELHLAVEDDVFDITIAECRSARVTGTKINADLHMRFLPWRCNKTGIYRRKKDLSVTRY